MPRISENNNKNLHNASVNAGVIGTAPIFTDNDDGTYDLGAFDVLIYDNDTHEGSLKQYHVPESLGRSVADTPNEVRYVVVDNKATPGTPIIRDLLLAELPEINESNVLPLFTIQNENNEHIHKVDWDTLGQGLASKLHTRFVKTDRFKRESGAIISSGAGADHHVEVTEGRYWLGAVVHDVDPIDTSSATGDIVTYDGNSGTGAQFSIWGVNDDAGGDFGAVHVDVIVGGSGYASNETNVTVSGGSGTGLTIDYIQRGGEIVSATVNQSGINYETTAAMYFYHHTGTGFTVTITVGGSGEVLTAVLGAGGINYFVGDIINITGGGGSGATVRVDSVGGSRDVVTLTLIKEGAGYTAGTVATYEGWSYLRYTGQNGEYPNNGYTTTSGFFDTGSNDWVVSWWYRDLEKEPHFGYVLSDTIYSSFSEASASQPRNDLPPQFAIMATLIGRVICKDGVNVDSAPPNEGIVESAYVNEFQGTPSTSHENLSGLQGGIAGEHYHLTSTEHTIVSNGNITVADESTDTTCFPIFATDATGNISPKTGTNLTFDSANGTLAATIFSGTWDGTTISVAKGGTGNTSYLNGELLIGNSTGNTLNKGTLTAGTNIQIANGSGSITVGVSGTIQIVNGGTGQTTYNSGQLLIGNASNTLTTNTITGTANRVSVANGNGTITLSAPQDINTTSDVQFDSFGVGTAASGITGEIRATDNITAYYSDARLKNFEGTIESALDKVMSLNGYYFTENDTAKSLGYSNDRRQVGVSAQEIMAVLPEVVTDAPIDPEYMTVWYEKLVPLLIEAIKELKDEIDELKGK